jgi:hypothetical protein
LQIKAEQPNHRFFMEVKKLNAKILEFKSFLKRDRDFVELYKWESLSHFQEHWDIEAPDFGKMYDQSLQNTKTQRLWKRENWRPNFQEAF